MVSRDFAAEEMDDGFNVTYPGDPEPIFVAKFGLDPSVAEQIRSRVVPNDAPGHQAGVLLANAMPQQPMTQEEQDAAIAEQAAYTQASLAAEPAPEIGPQELAGPPLPPDATDGVIGTMPGQLPRTDAPFTDVPLPVQAPSPLDVMNFGYKGQAQTIRDKQAAEDAATVAATALSPEEQAMAQRSLGGREAGKFDAFQTQAADKGSGSGSVAAKYAVSTKGGGGGIDSRVRPMPTKPDDGLLAQQTENAMLLGEIAAQGELDKAKVIERAQVEKQAVDKQWQERIAANDRTREELANEIRNGKVDPTRLWGSMDGGRQALTMIGLVLGGLSGRNGANELFERMINRDLDAQKDALGRKESLLSTYMQTGRDMQSAWQMAKADMQQALAEQILATAARNGAPKAMALAEQQALGLRQAAKAAQDAAEGAWRDDEFKRIDVQSQAALRGAQANSLRIETAFKAMTGGGASDGPGKNPPMEIAPGVIVQPSDATSRQNLEKAVDAFNTMRNLIVEARAHRAEHGAQLIPRTAAYVKANRLEKQLITALNNVENLGAFDRGTADLLGQIVPTIGGVYTPKVVDESLADLLTLATKKFQTKVMTNVVPGTGLVNFTGAQGDFKPVGKAD